jgi:hypothetical protein
MKKSTKKLLPKISTINLDEDDEDYELLVPRKVVTGVFGMARRPSLN